MSTDRRRAFPGLRAGLLTALLLLARPVAATEPSGAAILDRAREAQGSYETLRADFVQERAVSLVRGTLRSSGTFLLDRSQGRVTWIVDDPEPLRIVLSANGVFADGERIDRGAPGGIGPLAVARGFVDFFAASSRELERDFEITAVGDDRVRLKPRREALRAWLDAVEIAFGGERRLPRTIVLEEVEGDRTTIRLDDVTLDPGLAADAFDP